MPEQPIKDKTAIVGLGWTAFSRNSGVTTLTLAAQASLKAIADAGLQVQDIDGVVSFYHRIPEGQMVRELVRALGLKKCNFEFYSDGGGGWNCGAVLSGAMLVHSGICKNVLVFKARNRYSQGRAARAERANDVKGDAQFTTPFGIHHAAASFGPIATAHMARYGTTTLDFAHLAVTERSHAALNQKAMMRKPITIEDHQNSRWIVYPFRLLDCCQESDGGVALVITSAERARDLKHAPVYIMSGMGGQGQTSGLWETNGTNSAPLLYEGAGITPKDVSIAEIYDPFTAMCMIHIEDFGLVKKGEIGGWVTAGRNRLDGDLPVNTHGGLMSEAHIHGLNHVIEAVQQLRPEGVVDDLCNGAHTFDRSTCRQVRNPETALVCGECGESAMLLEEGVSMAEYAKPLPVADIDSQQFWDGCQAHELSAQSCHDCGKFRWPPQAFCPHCYSWKFVWTKLNETGTVASFVVVHYVSIAAFQDDVPYVVAHITVDGTDEQVTLISNVIDCPWQEVRVGMPVRVLFEDVTSEVTLPKFRPA